MGMSGTRSPGDTHGIQMLKSDSKLAPPHSSRGQVPDSVSHS